MGSTSLNWCSIDVDPRRIVSHVVKLSKLVGQFRIFTKGIHSPTLHPVPSYPVRHPDWQLPSIWLHISWKSSQLHCPWQLSPQVFLSHATKQSTSHGIIRIDRKQRYFQCGLVVIIITYQDNIYIYRVYIWWKFEYFVANVAKSCDPFLKY